MVQIKSNSGPIEDSALSQALVSDNRNAKDSFHGTILKAPKGSAKDDALPEDKHMQLPSG